MNPAIQTRWGLLCQTCQTALINPNQPWPQECNTCGQRTHVKCLAPGIEWLVELDIDMDPNQRTRMCGRCRIHAANNDRLIQNLPQASGGIPQDAYKRWRAQQPAPPKRSSVNLWGPYRVDPDNFVPAVTKVLDIVHSAGPKVRWAVKLGAWSQVPVTNLGSKEIMLPNYFDSPHALGRTHQEILDAMTGAAMHEAGHAAYDSASTIIEAQKRIKPGPSESTWASATCLNVVCDYNLERKVIARYPAFRHFFTECHRWSVRDTLPSIVKSVNETDAQDKLNVRIAVVVWEMLGPGDLEHAGAIITPKLKWITQKCFSILKYSYDRGHLNSEAGKLKTARALYELMKVVNPVGYVPPVVVLPPTNQPPSNTPPPPPDPDPDIIFIQPGSKGPPPPPGTEIPEIPEQENQPEDDDESDAQGDAEGTSSGTPGDHGRPGDDSQDGPDGLYPGSGDDEPGDDSEDPGSSEGVSEEASSESPGSEQAPGDPRQGDPDTDGDGTGTDSGRDAETPGTDRDTDSDTEAESPEDDSEDQGDDDNDGDAQSGSVGDPGDTGTESGEAQSDLDQGSSHHGGMSGSEKPAETPDPFTGKSDLEDDPTRRKNSRKDALDDLAEENAGRQQIDEKLEPGSLTDDEQFTRHHREQVEAVNNVPSVDHRIVPKDSMQIPSWEHDHAFRVRLLAPVIGRLKKILKFRNVDWGGRLTGRRSGTLTRRHVSRLSTLGSEKVFHKTQPDATPKVRIALLVDESESMKHKSNSTDLYEPYIGARNAATALTAALHGVRGVKLWCWGYASVHDYRTGQGRINLPALRQYVDPYHATNPVTIEIDPMFGGTPTGEAMDYAADVICKSASPDEKKVIFIITDGEAGGMVSTATAVRKWTGKVTFVHIGIGATVDKDIPFYVGPVTDISILPDLLSESVSEILR